MSPEFFNDEQKKYKLLETNRIERGGKTYYQIEALQDFINERTGVSVKTGDLGGHIQSERNLSQHHTAWVAKGALVGENASVERHSWAGSNTQISGNAVLTDYALAEKNSILKGDVRLCGSALASGNALLVDGYVSGDSIVTGDTKISGKNTMLTNDTELRGNSSVHNAIVWGGTQIDAQIGSPERPIPLAAVIFPENSKR